MTTTTITIENTKVIVISMNTTKREAKQFGNLESKKGFTPIVACYDVNGVDYLGYGYNLTEAIANSKIKS
tara:strand:+ start:118 stop:327 length:210 start_codon:yes stop_codon:yes gene_type:complete